MSDTPSMSIVFQSATNYGWLLDSMKVLLSTAAGGLVAYGVNIAITRKGQRQINIGQLLHLQTYLLYILNSLDSLKRTYIQPYQKVTGGNISLPSRGSIMQPPSLDFSKYVFLYSLREKDKLNGEVAILMKKLPEHLSNVSEYYELIRGRDTVKSDYNVRLATAIASGVHISGVPESLLEPSLSELKSLTDIIFVRTDELVKDSLELLYRSQKIAAIYDSRAILEFETPGYNVKFTDPKLVNERWG